MCLHSARYTCTATKTRRVLTMPLQERRVPILTPNLQISIVCLAKCPGRRTATVLAPKNFAKNCSMRRIGKESGAEDTLASMSVKCALWDGQGYVIYQDTVWGCTRVYLAKTARANFPVAAVRVLGDGDVLWLDLPGGRGHHLRQAGCSAVLPARTPPISALLIVRICGSPDLPASTLHACNSSSNQLSEVISHRDTVCPD